MRSESGRYLKLQVQEFEFNFVTGAIDILFHL